MTMLLHKGYGEPEEKDADYHFNCYLNIQHQACILTFGLLIFIQNKYLAIFSFARVWYYS